MIDLHGASGGEIGREIWFSDLLLAALSQSFTGGVLVHTTEGDQVAFFRSGTPLHAGGPGFRQDLIGELLVEAGACSQVQVDEAVKRQGAEPSRPLVGTCLVALGVDPGAVKRAAQAQTTRRLEQMLSLQSGTWQAAAGESARVREVGVPVDGWKILLEGLPEHASDKELKTFADELLGKAVQEAASPSPLSSPRIDAFSESARKVLRYLNKPRKPDQLERAVENRRLVRAVLKMLDRTGVLERHPAAKGIPIPKATLLKGVAFPSSAPDLAPLSPQNAAPEAQSDAAPDLAPSSAASSSRPPSSARVPTSSTRPLGESTDITSRLLREKERTQLIREVQAFHASMGDKNHFEILGVDRKVDAATLRKSYTALAKRFHPDAFGQDAPDDVKERLKEVSARLNEAYEILSNKERLTGYLALLDDKRFLGDERKAARIRDADVKAQMGLVMLRKRDFPSARDLFSVAMDGDPDNPIYRAHYAWALFADPKSDREPAIEKAYLLLLEAHRSAQKNTTILCYLGQVLKAQGRMKEALHHFKEVMAIEPKNAEAIREVRLISGRLEKTEDTGKLGPISKLFKR